MNAARRAARSKAAAGRVLILAITLLLALVPVRQASASADPGFESFLRALWPEAQKLGVTRATFESAIRGLDPDLSLPDLVLPGRPDRPPPGQAEFVQTPAEYLRESAFDRLAAHGRTLAEAHRATLAAIERRFGVPPEIVLAIWGRETDFGRYRLPHDALRVLATQAYYGRRKALFREEFLVALRLLQEGQLARAAMRSSWAGAMGLTQFLPSDFDKHAVDFDGDGRRDIFTSVPDALASAAKQLAGKGWQRGRQWAYEVRVPPRTDCTLADPALTRPLSDWIARGFALAHGRTPRPEELAEPASLLMPAGVYGPGFLILRNYYVIKDYNFSDLYVLFVGHLADRIAAARPFEKPWSKVVQLRTEHLEEMQRRLAALGFYADKIDGKAGMKTRLAVGAFQKVHGARLDCWPAADLLNLVRARSGGG